MRPPLALLLVVALLAPVALAAGGESGGVSVETLRLSQLAPTARIVDLACGSKAVIVEGNILGSLVNTSSGLSKVALEVNRRLQPVRQAVWLAVPQGEPGNYTVTVVLRAGYEDYARLVVSLLAPLKGEGLRGVRVIVDDLGITAAPISWEEAESAALRARNLSRETGASIGFATINGVPILIVGASRLVENPDVYLSSLASELGLCNTTIIIVPSGGQERSGESGGGGNASLAGADGVRGLGVRVVTSLPVGGERRELFGPEVYVPGMLLAFAALVAGVLGHKMLS